MSEDRVRAIFEASYTRLVGQLYAVCGDLSEAEDVVAEAFAKAVQHRSKFERADNPEAWLRTVAVNLSRSRWRRRQRGRRLERLAQGQAQGDERHPEIGVERLAVIAALRRLPRPQREAIALHYLADLPLHEVATATGVPLGTVKARLSRGRTALAALLAAHDEELSHDR